MTDPRAVAPLALEVTRLSKSYPGVNALRGVSLQVRSGEVHGLVGENGAGKSTLLKSIAGAVPFDSGSVRVLGTDLVGGNPRQAAEAGLAMIYQELTIVPELSASDNVHLGDPPRRFGVVDRRRVDAQFREAAARIGLQVAPRAKAGSLSTANQQLLEIVRAMVSERRLVIMDEPTASLGPEDIGRLHAVIRGLRETGHAVVYVSHDLDAVLDICDAVTVLREEEVVESRPAAEWTKPALIRSMLGGVELDSAGAGESATTAGDAVLSVRGLRAPGVRLDELDVAAGQIIGVAGLVGSGRSRLLRALAGALLIDEGRCEIRGERRTWPRSPAAAWRLGIAMAPEDRKLQGLVLDQSAAWNIALGDFSGAAGRGPVTLDRLRAGVRAAAEAMAFSASRLVVAAGTLSGGNQQKLMLARLMNRSVSVLLLDEPTRGIDIGAKAHVFTAMREIADSGRTVIWSSSEIEEVLEHSDRVLVVAGGRVIDELPPRSSPHDVLTRIFDHQRTHDVRSTDGEPAL
ncbi:sugar ABC transporter ATP-binding protein [Yonghaparkia sp. Soil809]|uniref:sugar ABC transporter ATP-binding protein n=1 Tax=Yonghaparkia sp. Soil809 TaxID=1736417 RepID=UPI000700A8EC|nr:sugar ABC transporter ATP-binding protein [Yonghaparkia sp. Soil809]KRF30855.1 hypothetical protein ASG83_08315 [Yonghaparkia sp. Soil809]